MILRFRMIEIFSSIIEAMLVLLIFIYTVYIYKKLPKGSFKKIFIFLALAMFFWTLSSFLYLSNEIEFIINILNLRGKIPGNIEIIRYALAFAGFGAFILVSKKIVEFSAGIGMKEN